MSKAPVGRVGSEGAAVGGGFLVPLRFAIGYETEGCNFRLAVGLRCIYTPFITDLYITRFFLGIK